MIISGSSVAMVAASTYAKTTATTTSTTTSYHGDGFTNTTVAKSTMFASEYRAQNSAFLLEANENNIDTAENKDVYTHTDEKEQKEEPVFKSLGEHIKELQNQSFDIKELSDPKLAALKNMLALLHQFTGKKFGGNFSLFKPEKNGAMPTGTTQNPNAVLKIQSGTNSQPASAAISAPQNGYWTRQVSVSAFEEGHENLMFSSKGTAVTADGREISFNVSMEMSQSFSSSFEMTGVEEEFVVTDPLVINLGSETAGVSDMKFFFDLNNDGTKDNISMLKSGSAFLALDKNKDGEINNGGELFGAKTGDGFAELAQYDEDGNGWIDEADSVFESLSVWMKNDDGTDKLVALSKAGVGAIFLGSGKADYTLIDDSGKDAAYIRSTGVFLHEDGSAGTIQHIDFRA